MKKAEAADWKKAMGWSMNDRRSRWVILTT
jgi:hypothetical protein